MEGCGRNLYIPLQFNYSKENTWNEISRWTNADHDGTFAAADGTEKVIYDSTKPNEVGGNEIPEGQQGDVYRNLFKSFDTTLRLGFPQNALPRIASPSNPMEGRTPILFL